MSFKSSFLPAGILLAVVMGLLMPEAGQWVRKGSVGPLSMDMILVIVIFFVYGWELETGILRSFDRKFFTALVAVLFVSLAGGPALALLTAYLLGLEGAPAAGLAVMCCGPTTLSSAVVIADVAGGRRIWALSFTIIMNILGVFIFPFTLGLLLGQGGSGTRLDINEVAMLTKILKVVILPMAAGLLFRLVTRLSLPRGSGYLPSSCIMLVVWMAVSDNARILMGAPLGTILRAEAAVLLAHLMLLVASWLSGRLLAVDGPGVKAMTFIGSQKTLPVAMAAILILQDSEPSFRDMVGEATVVCVMFHASQIIADSLISGWWRTRTVSSSPAKAG
jgi:sodium/bile acid cotransporter 7